MLKTRIHWQKFHFITYFLVTILVVVVLIRSQKRNSFLIRDLDFVQAPVSDDSTNIVTGSTTLHLTLSIPKSGTTALGWIAYSLFKNIQERMNDRQVEVYSPDKQVTLVLDDYKVSFNTNKKHRGVLHECRRGKVKKAMEFPFAHHLNIFLRTNHSANTEHFRRILKKSRALKITENDTSCRGAVRHVAIFRDPIATAVSYQKYYFPKSTKEEISNILIRKACDKRPALTAAVWILSTEVMPSLGFKIETVFYKDLRKHPRLFVNNFANLLGLNIDDDIISSVVNETSPEMMRHIQEQMKSLPRNSTKAISLKKHFQGLSGRGQNSRKVRTASLKGYENEITPEALAYCRERAQFHLPPILQEKFDLT